ncbi:lipoyl synthase [Mycoplasmatota bacterium zrk1]
MERKPEWLKIKVNAEHKDVSKLLRKNNLHTVCEEAFCPNRMECFAKKTATFMILGEVCTRNCRYCNVTSGNPKPVVDDSENILETISKLGLKYVVVTSVTRDDLKDGGASQFVKVIEKVKDKECKIEVLIPDFLGDLSALKKVVMSKPDVLNHNIETTKNIFSSVRPKGDYNQSLELIKRVKEIDPNMTTKSGFMVGLGESYEDVVETLKDLRSVNCDIVTIGQYLQPSKDNIKVAEYIHIDKFEEFKKIGLKLGFKNVYSGPFVRSSYNAEEIYEGEDI